jgi:hypothetical protein
MHSVCTELLAGSPQFPNYKPLILGTCDFVGPHLKAAAGLVADDGWGG